MLCRSGVPVRLGVELQVYLRTVARPTRVATTMCGAGAMELQLGRTLRASDARTRFMATPGTILQWRRDLLCRY